ncbi:MAG TPA: redoxin domain-containing protein [Acidimicrobiales bacterium]|nr:redoxin domain-containing protein [Acidimicrobiales bacterium]
MPGPPATADPLSHPGTSDEEPPAREVTGARRRSPIRWVAISLLVILVPFLVLLGTKIGSSGGIARSPLLGQPAPAFSVPRIDQRGALASSELAGRLYVVNFWASWCVPCRENPVLESFYRRWQPAGVELVGILYGDQVDAALKFRREIGGSWPLVDDPGGRVAVGYGVRGVPETFVVDGRGVVMAKLVGAVGEGTLDAVIDQIRTGGAPVTAKNDRYRTRR